MTGALYFFSTYRKNLVARLQDAPPRSPFLNPYDTGSILRVVPIEQDVEIRSFALLYVRLGVFHTLQKIPLNFGLRKKTLDGHTLGDRHDIIDNQRSAYRNMRLVGDRFQYYRIVALLIFPSNNVFDVIGDLSGITWAKCVFFFLPGRVIKIRIFINDFAHK